ncbi:MAG: hypothetical protein JNL60_11225 [Bacteroidia bacterium]|nr:hypothetical protein [Bacteroidia bacterium]
MYTLSDHQIDFILNDIRARGVEMEDLQYNLLDHICCIIEKDLETNGDFESFYQKTIRSFYKDALWEIEEETISLLTFKHYYTMKKLMIWSGAFSVFTLAVGIWFKFMYWPGATLALGLGIVFGSLIFLPLLFTLKAKEQQSRKDKIVMVFGALGTIVMCLSFLFKVLHWPHSSTLAYLSAVIMLFVFLPLYFFAGIRKAETKLNTITTSMLVILVYCMLLLTIRTPRLTSFTELNTLQELGISQEILLNEYRMSLNNPALKQQSIQELNDKIFKLCNESKTYIFWRDTGLDTNDTQIREFNYNKRLLCDPFKWDPTIEGKINKLGLLVDHYNYALSNIGNKKLSRIRTIHTILDNVNIGSQNITRASVINQLNQIEMFIFQNTRTLLAMK